MSSNNVVMFPGITRLNMPVDVVLEEAKKDNMKAVIVIGTDEDGEFCFASTIASGPEVLWLLRQAEVKLLQCGKVLPECEE